MSKIYENIAVTLDSADEILTNLLSEYDRSLANKKVSVKAHDLTHQICTLLRSALDRAAYRYWNLKVAPGISAEDREKAKSTIYFPAGGSKESVDSTLGNWRWKSVKDQHQELYDYLLSIQPTPGKNKWLTVLFDLSVQGKHIDLVPQKRYEERRVTVSRGDGIVSWNPDAVRFGSGPGVQVRVAGAQINPATQRIFPTEGVTERLETWVSFIIDGHNVNAAGFCKEGCAETRRIIQEMTDKFGLS